MKAKLERAGQQWDLSLLSCVLLECSNGISCIQRYLDSSPE